MELSLLFLTLPITIVFLFLLWFFFFTDRDLVLALAEKFGRSVSVFRGKVIWLTGASSGLGEAMAYELASVGAKLALTARNETRLEQVKNKCLEIAEGKMQSQDILVLPFDVTHNDVHKAKVNDVLQHFEQIDVLVNNAGRTQVGRTGDTDIELDRDTFEVNFFGAISLTKLVLKHFLDRGSGHIVVVTSIFGKHGCAGLASYAATKHALHGYYESLRTEYYNDNIHVTMVCPSFFESEIASSAVSTKKGEKRNSAVRCSKEMGVSRCAYLVLVAAANRLCEVWIAYQPFLLGTYASQIFPDIFRYVLLLLIFSKRRVQECCEGKFPNDIYSWKPFSH